MAKIKISQLTAKGSNLANTDLLPIAEVSGAAYVSRKVTGAEINELSLDTSPQLGGNLDVNGNSIVSTSNGNINITPNGTGAVVIGGNSTQATELRFMEDSDNGTNYVALKANNTLAANTTYTLPTADGTSGQVLSTNGTGTLSWATAGGGITVGTTAVTSGTNGRVFFQAGGVLQQSANLFWDNSNSRLGIGTASPTTAIDVNGTIRIDNTSFTGNALTIAKTANSTTRITAGPSGEYIQFGGGNTISLVANQISIPNALILANKIEAAIGNSTGLLINNTSTTQGFVAPGVTGISLQTTNWRNDGAGGASTINAVRITPNIEMTVGTVTGNVLLINPVINTTGGTHTIRGLYYNPTLTSTTGVTNRAIETTTGDVIFNTTSGNVAIGGTSFGSSSDKVFAQYSGIAPGSSPADAFQMYSADVVAGNAAPHIRTENGNIVKIYQETTGVGSATVASAGAGNTIKTDDTFDGYTIQQVVKALRNLGILA